MFSTCRGQGQRCALWGDGAAMGEEEEEENEKEGKREEMEEGEEERRRALTSFN